MSLIVKIMSEQNLDDRDAKKEFKLVSVPDGSSVNFMRNPDDEAIVVVSTPATRSSEFRTEIHPQPGNAYVLNEQGKTIAIRNNKSEVVRVPMKEGKEVSSPGGPTVYETLVRAAQKHKPTVLNAIFKYLESGINANDDRAIGMVEELVELLKNARPSEPAKVPQALSPCTYKANSNTAPVPTATLYQDKKNPGVPYPQPSPNSRAYPPRPTGSLLTLPKTRK